MKNALCILLLFTGWHTTLAARPNFVIIFTDDQGYGDLSCFGAEHVSTPRIDQMAAVRSGDWKLHVDQRGRPSELFNLKTDISEKANVLKANPEIAARLMKYLSAFAKNIAENNRPAAFVENPKPLSM
ncbi:MAG: sulfatase-like hydrolase/transferase [Fuerstiella sp.]